MAIYNAYVLFSKITSITKTSFCLNIAEGLLEQISLPNYKTRGRPVSSDTPTAFSGEKLGTLLRIFSTIGNKGTTTEKMSYLFSTPN